MAITKSWPVSFAALMFVVVLSASAWAQDDTISIEPPGPEEAIDNLNVAPAEEPPAEEPQAEIPQSEAPQADEIANESEPAPEPEQAPIEPVVDERAKNREQKKICNCRFASSVSYVDRRSPFGGFIGFQYGMYQPVKYDPDFAGPLPSGAIATYDNYYSANRTGNMELIFGAKWNFFGGSVGTQVSGGVFQARNNDSGAMLQAMPVTAGIIYELNNLFNEPYVVPYALAGGYVVIYSESVGGLKVSGNTALAPFYAAGLQFQLDWIDPETHDSAYEEHGIENTFLYVEARSFLPAAQIVPDFSTPLQFSGGLRVEF